MGCLPHSRKVGPMKCAEISWAGVFPCPVQPGRLRCRQRQTGIRVTACKHNGSKTQWENVLYIASSYTYYGNLQQNPNKNEAFRRLRLAWQLKNAWKDNTEDRRLFPMDVTANTSNSWPVKWPRTTILPTITIFTMTKEAKYSVFIFHGVTVLHGGCTLVYYKLQCYIASEMGSHQRDNARKYHGQMGRCTSQCGELLQPSGSGGCWHQRFGIISPLLLDKEEE